MPDSNRARGPYRKGVERRREIVAAAATLFGESGYTHSSMRELAKRVGLSQALLLHYFSDKEDLLVEVLNLRDASVADYLEDIADRDVMGGLIGPDVDLLFHLAAVVSGAAEADFDLGMRINLDGSRGLLELCRRAGRRPRVVFTSSVAVYGGALPPVVTDETPLNPRSSYGVQKAIGELLLADYTRKGFVDGRILRLPTISVRPGAPNKAIAAFAKIVPDDWSLALMASQGARFRKV